jgi:hypothetical protein
LERQDDLLSWLERQQRAEELPRTLKQRWRAASNAGVDVL